MKNVLIEFSRYLKNIFNVLWTFRLIMISLLVMYLALWMADQGQDLLVNLNGSDFGVIIFFSAITINALLHWHLPKYLSVNTKGKSPDSLWGWIVNVFNGSVAYEEQPEEKKKAIKIGAKSEIPKQEVVQYVEDSDLARMFGVATFLIPAFGILNVMDKYGFGPYHPGIWLLVSLGVLALALHLNWIDNLYKNYPRFRLFTHFILGLCMVVLIINWKINDLSDGAPADLIYVFWSLFSMAIFFFIIVSIRRYITFSMVKTKEVARYIMWPGVIAGALFIVLNFFPTQLAKTETNTVQYATISILLLGLIFYLLFFSVLIFWGRSSKINVTLFFVLLAFICAKVIDNRFHDVNTVSDLGKPSPSPPTLENYTKQWLLKREETILEYDTLKSKDYPVFILTCYGGGIRAAAWTSLVIAHLDSLVETSTSGRDSFQDHAFAYSGASGGTIGASVMCALRSQNYERSIYPNSLTKFYQSDFLSPVITGLIGRDFFYSTFGFTSYWVKLRDRANLQEEIWEYHMQEHFGNKNYGEAFSTCWSDSTYQTPLLFSNSTYVEKGLKGIAAPVKLDPRDFPSAVYIPGLLKEEELKLSSAAFLSARFPFISPAGRIDSVHHFLDGGIFENSGAETGAEIASVFERVLTTDPALQHLKDKVKIVVLSLRNSPEQAAEVSYKNLFEIAAPLKALVSKVDGGAIRADSVNAIYFDSERVAGSCSTLRSYYRVFPPMVEDPKESNVIIPLGWQLSGQALTRLKKSLSYTVTDRKIQKLMKEL